MIPVIFDVVRDQQVELAVAVVIKPSRGRTPSAIITDACVLGHVGKRAIVIIVVENRVTVTGEVDIGISVIVEVADSYTGEKMSIGLDPALGGHIGKCAVTVIAEKGSGPEWKSGV
jgi:hypothetical protein